MAEISEEIRERIEELEEIALDAMEEIKKLSDGNILYDHRLKRFIEM